MTTLEDESIKIPADIRKLAEATWLAAVENGTPDAALIIGLAILAERQRSKIDEIEIDDGQMTVRLGSLSMTVFASSATLYDTSKQVPAKKVPLYRDVFFKDAAPFLAAAPSPLGASE